MVLPDMSFAEPARGEPVLQLPDGEGQRRSTNPGPAGRKPRGPGHGQEHRPILRPAARRPRVPVTAARIARSSGKAAGATVALATSKIALAAPKVAVLAPAHVVFAGRPRRPPLCLFVLFSGCGDDPSTRYKFPESANRCHAASTRNAGSVAFFPRIVAAFSGTKRPQPIGVAHQTTYCLTTAHETCTRFRAVKEVAANR